MEKTIGERIKNCRMNAGYSQEELANQLYIKRNTLSLYESDKRDIPSSVLLRIANELKVSPSYLLLGEDIDNKWEDEMYLYLKRIKDRKHRKIIFRQIECLLEIEDEM